MRTVAIANQKGGTAKTATAVNLAAALAERGRRVLVVDLDPQANASAWFGVRDDGGGLLDVLTDRGQLADLVRRTSVEGVDLVAATPALVGAERALAAEVGAETLLRRKLGKLPAGRWDYVIFDTPPTLGILTLSALVASREVLVPVECHAVALAGLAQLLQTLDAVRDRLNPELTVAGVLACRLDGRTRHAQDVLDELRAKLGRQVLKTAIRESVRFAEAWSFAKPVTAYASASTGAEDYRALAGEIVAQERKARATHG